VQLIAPPESGLSLSQVDLWGHADPEAELERLAAEEAAAPFDLTHGPLVRGRLIRLAANDHVLLVTMHHIVSDGWSMGVLVNEFSALYTAFSQGRTDPLPPLPIQYADYAAWQRHWIASERLQRQLDFWRDHLSGAPTLLELPTDRPRPTVQDYAGASVGFELDAELTANLKALSQRHGTTLFMTLLASWAALLARLSGQHDVVIGTPVANRHRAEIEPLIGFFVNTQALRVDVSGSPSVAELLAQVRSTALAAQAHQDIPFEQVVEALSHARSMAHSPIFFQVMFAWQNAPGGSLDLPGLQSEPVEASATTVKFDLELTLHEAGERIAGSLGYACALFDRSSIERHLGHWQTLLRGLVADDGASVARLPLLTATQQQHLLHAFNDSAAPFPHEQCIHQLFEEQAARTPEATALVFEGTSLTYRELNARANQLAHHLIALGVQTGDCVALALPRSDDRGCRTRGAQVRRGLRATGPGPSQRTPAFHAGRLRRACAGVPQPLRLARAGAARSGPAHRHGRLPRSAAAGATARQRLRDVHLRLHRHPQGRRGAAPWRGQPGAAGAPGPARRGPLCLRLQPGL
jgi:hypothetical protein